MVFEIRHIHLLKRIIALALEISYTPHSDNIHLRIISECGVYRGKRKDMLFSFARREEKVIMREKKTVFVENK